MEGRHSAFPGADRRLSFVGLRPVAPDGARGKAECLPSEGPYIAKSDRLLVCRPASSWYFGMPNAGTQRPLGGESRTAHPRFLRHCCTSQRPARRVTYFRDGTLARLNSSLRSASGPSPHLPMTSPCGAGGQRAANRQRGPSPRRKKNGRRKRRPFLRFLRYALLRSTCPARSPVSSSSRSTTVPLHTVAL